MSIFQRKLLKITKGITLLELMVTIGLNSIIIAMILPMFLRINFLYNKLIVSNRNYSYANEAMLDIENRIDNSKLTTFVNSNKILIEDLNGTFNEIYFMRNKGDLGDIVRYEKTFNSKPNDILSDISDFNFAEKENLIYINITTMDGKKYERCLSLKK